MFRKGNVLLGPNEMEGEYAGEDLRIEVSALTKAVHVRFKTQLLLQLLEAMVERPPPRPLIDEFGMELDLIPREELSPLLSPELPDETKKPAPRPYVSRARSSEAVSPTVGHLRTPPLPSSSPIISSPVSPTSPIVGGRPYQVRSRSSSSGDTTEIQ